MAICGRRIYAYIQVCLGMTCVSCKLWKTMMEIIFTKLAGIAMSVGMDKLGERLKKWAAKKQLPIEEIKRRTQILFVDDESFENRLNEVRDAGWNVRQIQDVTNFDSEDIKAANIIFMDYKGVGLVMTASEEGIGLLKQLKKKYPDKKLVFYSGYSGTIPGHEVHNIADRWIQKHVDTVVYVDLIEELAREVYD